MEPASATSTGELHVPILVYHVVRPAYPSDSAAVRAIAQTPEVFDAELTHLADAGYHVITFAELESALASSTPLPAKPVVITLDDGWQDQFTYAAPILEAHKVPATFFIFTNAIDRKDFMTLDDLKQLVAAGFSIGAHSRSHPYLTHLSAEKQQDEIAGSKRILEEDLGIPIREFAYPFGMYDATTTAIVRAAGFSAARKDGGSPKQSQASIYELGSMNAPTTLESFDQYFP
jgi:peptidoglycan/xylan/chitin deacetylase (PgdA/CDA1 family)